MSDDSKTSQTWFLYHLRKNYYQAYQKVPFLIFKHTLLSKSHILNLTQIKLQFNLRIREGLEKIRKNNSGIFHYGQDPIHPPYNGMDKKNEKLSPCPEMNSVWHGSSDSCQKAWKFKPLIWPRSKISFS